MSVLGRVERVSSRGRYSVPKSSRKHGESRTASAIVVNVLDEVPKINKIQHEMFHFLILATKSPGFEICPILIFKMRENMKSKWRVWGSKIKRQVGINLRTRAKRQTTNHKPHEHIVGFRY